MLTAKPIVVTGRIVRQEDNKIYIRHGEAVEMYNTDYYRVIPEGGEQEDA